MLGIVSKYIEDVSVLRRLLFAVVHLPSDLPNLWRVAVEFATKDRGTQESITDAQAKVLVENIQELDALAFSTDRKLLGDLIDLEVTRCKPLGLVLISGNDKCIQCGSKLQLRKERPSSVVIYDERMGTIPGSHYHKTCSNRACGCTQFYGYTTGGSSSEVCFDPDWESLPYFVSSRESVFSLPLLRQFDSEILIGQMSFKQCADAYNYLHIYTHLLTTKQGVSQEKFELHERQKLDRRRAEAAYFQYAVLRVASWYPATFKVSELPLHNSLVGTLSKVITDYHGAFMEAYSRHQCETKGCGHALVIDGNMKNHRDVCFAANAGYVEYKGLPGRVRSGCPHTPGYKSRYCSLHKPVIAIPQNVSPHTSATDPSTSANEEDQVGIIISKRVTRKSTLYQVVWLGRPVSESTWELATSLPQKLVDDYEEGVQHDICQFSSTSGGQTIHAISTARKDKDDLSPPDPKRACRIVETSNSGVFEVNTQDKMGPRCNTEKDRVRVNNRTAGIVVGAWPCGTIIMLAELFGAESKSQVYGVLHTFLQENKDATSLLRYIIYDDGCHLKKYACNPSRRICTPTAERLASLNIVVDRLHFRGHVDAWCHQNCNPHMFDDLKDVDTEICEQLFSWLSRYARITQHMNQQHFLFYILYLCDAHNRKRLL